MDSAAVNRKRKTYKWNFKAAEKEGKLPEFFRELGLNETISRILFRRGFDTKEKVFHFLYDNMDNLADPFLMKGMEAGARRIAKAVLDHEKVVVYGDYDVDGITSTSILCRYLRRLGADVHFYIPDRAKEGYGPNIDAFRKLAEEGNSLLITVDCGIAAADVVKEAPSSMDIIITDHHLPPENLPQCIAVINPHQKDCNYPYKELAGCGVAYTVCRAVNKILTGEDYREDVELAAMGTIADVVSLTGENRILVKEGLARFPATKILGIRALLLASGTVKEGEEPGPVSVEQVSYGLAPRLNAAGRIRTADMGVRLMLSDTEAEAQRWADALCETNLERQSIEKNINEEAVKRLHELNADKDKVIVVDGHNWNPGVIGIVASRILEQYHRPVLMITIQDGIGKGSCRSIPAFDIYEALKNQSDKLIQMGGHKMAAGFSIKEENIPAFRKSINEYADRILKPEDFIPVLDIEQKIPLSEVTLDFIRNLSILEPCGQDNPRPLFASGNLTVSMAKRIGKDQKHFKCVLNSPGADSVEAVFWNPGEPAPASDGDIVAAAYKPEIHVWHEEHVQLVLKDIHKRITLNRNKMIQAFYKLKVILPGVKPVKTVTWEMQKALMPEFSENEIEAILRVFEEISLIRRFSQNESEYYEYCRVSHKLSLESSETYCKLKY